MRRMNVESMTYRILQHLSENGSRRTCELAKVFGMSQTDFNPKLRKMEFHGRIERVATGTWAITAQGKADMASAVAYAKGRSNRVRKPVIEPKVPPLWVAAAHDRRRAHRRLSWSLGVAA